MSMFAKGRHGQAGYFTLADLPQAAGDLDAIGTGWWELDQIFKLYAGQFTITTGLAGSGKSTLWLNLICNLAAGERGIRSFMYVPENEVLIDRKLRAIWGNRDGWNYFRTEQCYVQSAQPEHYDDEPKTIEWVLDKAVISMKNDGVGLLFIDPWNELERAKPPDMLLTDYIGKCLMYLKQFCRAYHAMVVVVAHPTKAGVEHGRQPTLADVEGSMNWYNKADNGLIVVREPEGNTCRVVSAKVREIGAGKLGQCFFKVDDKTGLFTPQYGAAG